jgi:sporulation protein YlmC with PRC-barrel domain
MYVFRDIMDKQLVDCEGDKMGRVDDLLLELRPGETPAVRSILSGHGSGTVIFPSFLEGFARWLQERVLGLDAVEPIEIGWEHVKYITVAVHLDVDRQDVGGTDTEHRLWERWLGPLPGSRR